MDIVIVSVIGLIILAVITNMLLRAKERSPEEPEDRELLAANRMMREANERGRARAQAARPRYKPAPTLPPQD